MGAFQHGISMPSLSELRLHRFLPTWSETALEGEAREMSRSTAYTSAERVKERSRCEAADTCTDIRAATAAASSAASSDGPHRRDDFQIRTDGR